MIALNSSTVRKRDCEVTVAFNWLLSGCGTPPTSPAATSVFWLRIAEMMSPGINPTDASRSGSSQTRIAYGDPNTLVSPTPSIRESSS